MIQCKNCGKMLPDHAKYCSQCGTPISGLQIPPVQSNDIAQPTEKKIDWAGIKQRVVSAALVLASLILLSFNWVVTYGDSKYDLSGYRGEIQEMLYTIENTAGWLGYSVDLNGLHRVSYAVVDGKLTATETFTVSKECFPLMDDLSYLLDDATVTEYTGWAKLLFGLYIAAFVIAVASGAGAIILLIVNHDKQTTLQNVYLISILAIVVIFAIVCFIASENNLKLRPTVPAILSLILAWPRGTE